MASCFAMVAVCHDLLVDTLLLMAAFTTIEKWGGRKDLMAFFSHYFVTGGRAQITEGLIGKDNCVVLVDDQYTLIEMAQESVLVIWRHAVSLE